MRLAASILLIVAAVGVLSENLFLGLAVFALAYVVAANGERHWRSEEDFWGVVFGLCALAMLCGFLYGLASLIVL